MGQPLTAICDDPAGGDDFRLLWTTDWHLYTWPPGFEDARTKDQTALQIYTKPPLPQGYGMTEVAGAGIVT
jgi:hypothetical protein